MKKWIKKAGDELKDTKRNLIRDMTKRINALPDKKKQYVLGVMNGMLISYEGLEKHISEETST